VALLLLVSSVASKGGEDRTHATRNTRGGLCKHAYDDALAGLQMRHGHVHHPVEGHVWLCAEGVLGRDTNVGRLELLLEVARLALPTRIANIKVDLKQLFIAFSVS
jgi:hypothetical protein